MAWQDSYTIKALKEGYRARSVFKLREINNKFHIISPGNKVVDLGCYPGSWLKWCSQRAGKSGFVLGIDIKPTASINSSNIKIIKADVFEITPEEILSMLKRVDLLCSDMAPSTSGVKHLDRGISHALAMRALELAVQLIEKGNEVIKYFQSPDNDELLKTAKKYFDFVKTFKPKSSRQKSVEMYLVCKERNNKQYDEEDFS